MPEREQVFSKQQIKDFTKGTAIGLGIGSGLAFVANRHVRENKKHIQELINTGKLIDTSHELPFAEKRLTFSEEELMQNGLEFHAFGDSRMKVNVHAGKPLPEKWVHDGGFPLQLQQLFHDAGFSNVSVIPHAREGDPSERTLQIMERWLPYLLQKADKPLGFILYNTGNDYRWLFSKRFWLSLAVTYAPHIPKTGVFRREFDQITNELQENKFKKYQTIQNVHDTRVAKGLDEVKAVIVPTPSPYKFKDSHIVIWDIGKNGKKDKRKFKVRSSRSTDRGGRTITGGAVRADKESLKRVEKELPSLPIITVPCHEIKDDADYDGTYHYSLQGQWKVATAIAMRIDITSSNGKKESLYDRAMRMRVATSVGNS